MKTTAHVIFVCVMMAVFCTIAEAQSLENRLNRIMIKEISVEEGKSRDVFELVRQKSKEADPEGKGVNFVFQDMPEGNAEVTIKLVDVPLIKVIEYICIASKLKYRIDTHAVIISKDRKDEKKPAK
ncbi:MAG TPA: hypothetical protein DET40_20545 [Lentisphaeria bacterium]|nr:MAG: hypothetical protein A2X45_16220 [Lentisphaerae bacterium GWF2_50_93]HCE45942.1 hypothetical protein [Lentisphaeria bacterium]